MRKRKEERINWFTTPIRTMRVYNSGPDILFITGDIGCVAVLPFNHTDFHAQQLLSACEKRFYIWPPEAHPFISVSDWSRFGR